MGTPIDWAQQRDTQWTWRCFSRNFPDSNAKRKKNGKKKKTEHPALWDSDKRHNICVIRVLEGEEKMEQNKYLKK